jgi:hypothetical protein
MDHRRSRCFRHDRGLVGIRAKQSDGRAQHDRSVRSHDRRRTVDAVLRRSSVKAFAGYKDDYTDGTTDVPVEGGYGPILADRIVGEPPSIDTTQTAR